MSGVCHIVCAAPDNTLELDLQPGDFVIAVDGGFAYCLDAGIEPDILIGDLDSLSASLVPHVACETITLPRDKDDTDTIAACKEGLGRGYVDFYLHACLGGDMGHELAIVQTLAFLCENDAHGTIVGKNQIIQLVTPPDSPARFGAPVGTRVSVLAFGGKASGVFERGLKWELEDAVLSPTMPLGVSNVNIRPNFEVGVGDGSLLIVIGPRG